MPALTFALWLLAHDLSMKMLAEAIIASRNSATKPAPDAQVAYIRGLSIGLSPSPEPDKIHLDVHAGHACFSISMSQTAATELGQVLITACGGAGRA